MAEWAELGLHPACSLGRCVVRLLAYSPVSPSAPCSALKNAHEYSYPVAPLRRSTAEFGPVRGGGVGACAFVACAATYLVLIWCMIYLLAYAAGQNVAKFTMMDTKYSEKCYMGVKTVIFWWYCDKILTIL